MTFPTKLVITRTRAGQDGDTLYAEPFSQLLGHRFTAYEVAPDVIGSDHLSAWICHEVRSRLVNGL